MKIPGDATAFNMSLNNECSAVCLIFEVSTREDVTLCLSQLHGYQYAGASSSHCAALCAPSSMGRVQRICQTLLTTLVQATRVPDYVPHRQRTSHCHGCAQSSADVHLATPVPLCKTTCLKICAPLQTQRSSDSS